MLADYRFQLNFLVFSGLSCLPRWKTFAILEQRIGGALVECLVSGGHDTVSGQATTIYFDMGYCDIVTMLERVCSSQLSSLSKKLR